MLEKLIKELSNKPSRPKEGGLIDHLSEIYTLITSIVSAELPIFGLNNDLGLQTIEDADMESTNTNARKKQPKTVVEAELPPDYSKMQLIPFYSNNGKHVSWPMGNPDKSNDDPKLEWSWLEEATIQPREL